MTESKKQYLEKLFPGNSTCLVKKYLTKTLYKKLKNKATQSGYMLKHAIASGIANPDSKIGIYAGDAESYDTFAQLFDPIIADYHAYQHTIKMTGRSSEFHQAPLDQHNKYILSTRIRIARNLEGYPFPCFVSSTERHQIEQLILKAFKNFPGKLKGSYFPLKTFFDLKSTPVNPKLFPGKPDRFMEAAGMARDFPDARGVYLSDNHKFMVWINEEDHLRIISMEKGSDLLQVYNNLNKGIKKLNKELKFSHTEKYGFLTSCPSNIGITMRAGVHIRLPRLNRQKNILYRIVRQNNLQIRGGSGENSNIENSVFDISNKQKIRITEDQCLNILTHAVQKIICLEESLEKSCK